MAIERVASALREELKTIGYGVGTINAGQLADALARAAIKAMGEPTSEMIRIVERLAALDESQVSEASNYGDVSCVFCRACLSNDENHASECLWVAARECSGGNGRG